ncbi:MAG: hypothetical protein ACTSPY_12960 [Candidatus Helarchaeota archaeon]
MKKWLKVTLIILIITIPSIILGVIFIPILVDSMGPVPRFVNNDWLELDKISAIGKFRSTLGHGYGRFGDNNPTSDKHYFMPFFPWRNTDDNISVFAPVRAMIISIMWENHRFSDGSIQGKQIRLQSIEHPSIVFILFHINVEPFNLHLFQIVEPGQVIGYLDVRENSTTDIAVYRGGVYISWFEVLSDSLFETYKDRGIKTREMMIKTDAQVAESAANGYDFTNNDPSDWVRLKNTNYTHLINYQFINVSKLEKISYMSNSLYDTNDFYINCNKSDAIWFKVKDIYAGTFSTNIYAPFNSTIKIISYIDGGNSSITIWYYGTNYRIIITFYMVNITTGLNEGDILAPGQLIGTVKKYFAIRTKTQAWNSAFPVFGLMNDTIWNDWSTRGIENRTAMLLNHAEFASIQQACGTTDYVFNTTAPWWIPLT